MLHSFTHPFIFVDQTKEKGRGVYCSEDIDTESLIEIAPVIPLSVEDTLNIHKTTLHDYYFSWGDDQKCSAIALGYVSMYNHAEQPNCYYEADFENNTIKIISNRLIEKGEELTINYNMDGQNDNKLWFEVK
jgi:uncharacterized protein